MSLVARVVLCVGGLLPGCLPVIVAQDQEDTHTHEHEELGALVVSDKRDEREREASTFLFKVFSVWI